MTHTGIRLPLFALAGALLVLALLLSLDRAQPAHGVGATLVVHKSTAVGGGDVGDDVTSNSVCTLREAMKAARENVTISECGPNPGSLTELDTITFEADAGTLIFNLTAGAGADMGDLNPSNGVSDGGPLVIEHTDAGFVTISGNMVTNIMATGGSDNVTIRDITLSSGLGGNGGCGAGGISNGGTLSLDGVTMLGNDSQSAAGSTPTAICSTTGTVNIMHSSIFNNFGNATSSAVRISGDSTAEITNSNFSENAPGNVAGVIATGTATVSITSTSMEITDGGYLVSAQLGTTINLLNDTLIGHGVNHSLLQNLGTINAKNTIFASDEGCDATVTDQGYNLDSGDECGLDAGNNSLENANPMLGAANGSLGGGTVVYPLNTGSPAIDNGNNPTCPAFDQRGPGFPRPLDGDSDGTATCDIGAYEAPEGTNPSPTPAVTPVTTTPTQPATPTDTPQNTPAATTAAPTPTSTATPPVTASPTPVSTGATATLAQNPLQGDIDCDDDVDNDDFMQLLFFVAGLVEANDVPGCFDIGEFENNSGRGWGDVSCDDAEDDIDALYIVAYLGDVILEPVDPQCFPIGEHMT